MMRVMKRNIVIILLLSMIVSMFPTQAMTVEAGEEEMPASMASPDNVDAEETTEVPSDSTSYGQGTAVPEGTSSDKEGVTLTGDANGQDTKAVADESEDNALLFADTLTYGNLQYVANGDNVTITGCDEGVTSVSIPPQIDGKNVTAIANNAFNGRNTLTALTIPEGVTSLGSYMIRGTGIASITIPSTVAYSETSNGNGALAGCMALNEVVFAQGTVKIPDNICASPDQNSYIKSVKIPESIQEIGSYAFYNCASLSGAVDIPAATKVVGGGAFSGCTSVTSVTTHQNNALEWTGRIDGSAFARCAALTSVEIAGSIKSIGAYAFEECTKLSTVTLHEGITTLGNGLFNGCSALTALTIPEGVTSLGSYMIRGTGIASITIPSTVAYSETSNGNGALAGCMALNEVVFAQGTVKIPDNICASPDQNSYIERVYIPPSVTQIGS